MSEITRATPRRILILNWRDIYHPHAGGAERVTHEIVRRWVGWGHKVTLFTAAYPGAKAAEMVDGVQVFRHGRQMTVHWEAYKYYRHSPRNLYDIVIDEVNTIPFFAPLYVREPVIMFSHQLAREVWRYEAPFPLSMLGYMSEPLYLQAYRRSPIMTVSASTEESLREIGLSGPYHIIPEAVDTKAPDVLPDLNTKDPGLILAFVGRVVPSKRVDHLIKALEAIHKAGHRDARLWIIGAWDARYRHELDRIIALHGLRDQVIFWGRVDTATKEQLLARAHIFVMASVREGWGLVITEANMLGTPAVVYNVPGLRDSTINGETGLVCPSNTPQELARAALSLWQDRALYMRLRLRAWTMARTLSSDRTAEEAWHVVEKYLPSKENGFRTHIRGSRA